MNEKYLLNPLPSKFIRLAKTAIELEIEREIALVNDDTTPDEILAEIDYGNDTPILKGVVDEMNNPHQVITGDLYVLSQTADGTESTLQLFGKPIPKDETVLLVFLASDFDKAIEIKNRFLGFV